MARVKCKVAILIRHLLNHRPVVTSVIIIPSDVDLDYVERYAENELETVKKDFINKTPEFNNAMWYIDIVDF